MIEYGLNINIRIKGKEIVLIIYSLAPSDIGFDAQSGFGQKNRPVGTFLSFKHVLVK